MAKRQSNTTLPLCCKSIICFDISQPGEQIPPHPCQYPSILILLTFLPPSCPIPHLCSALSLLLPPLLLFLLCKRMARSYSISTALVFTFETRKTPTLRSKRRGVGLNSGVHAGGSPPSMKILFSHRKATIWLMFSKHRV